ncbi:MAG: hypothetical protein AABY30_01970, partial [Candidatus Thermoplasmatota archaeon]
QGRAYDLTFGTLKRRLRDAEGAWEREGGETLGDEVPVEAALFLQTPKTHLLLRPTRGVACASDRRLVFATATEAERTPEEPTRFNIAVHAPPMAVDQLFREGGREIVEVGREELRGTMETRAELTLRIEAPWVGGGRETATFLLVLRPLASGRSAVAPLGLS